MRQYEWLLGNCKQRLEQIGASDELQRAGWLPIHGIGNGWTWSCRYGPSALHQSV